MGVGFLNPWLLGALALVAGPVLIHLLNRNRSLVVAWGAMQLLRRVAPVRSRQLRLQDLPLMLLRCLVVLVAVLLLARPHLVVPGLEPQTAVLVAVDTSASMAATDAGGSRLDAARQRVRALCATLPANARLTLVGAGASPQVVAERTPVDAASVDAALARLQQGHDVLDPERTLALLARLAADLDAPQREAYLVTDAQAATWAALSQPASDSLRRLAETAAVGLLRVNGPDAQAAVVGLRWVSGAMRRGGVGRFEATIWNPGTQPVTVGDLRLLVGDAEADRQQVGRIEAGGQRVLAVHARWESTGWLGITAMIDGDAQPLDDRRFLAVRVEPVLRVLLVEGTTAAGMAAGSASLLAAAIQPQGPVPGLAVRTVPWLAADAAQLADADIICFANVRSLDDAQAAVLERRVSEGASMVVFAGDDLDPAAWRTRLLPATIAAAVPAGPGHNLSPELADDPLVEPLRRLPVDLVTDSRVLRWLPATPQPQARVLLRLDDGSPLWLVRAWGGGLVHLCTTSADSAWHDLAANPVFPILMQQVLAVHGAATPALTVGEPALVAADAGSVLDPAGVTLEAGGATRHAGMHRMADGRLVAVNLDAGESDLRTLSHDEAAAWAHRHGVHLVAGRLAGLGRQGELARILAALLAALLVIEILYARRVSRRQAVEP
jgi:hypothetical protein